MKELSRIRCPKCDWEPDKNCRWVCDVCNTRWNTFDTHGECPTCGKKFIDTMCSPRWGGCGEWSPNADWYEYVAKEATIKPSLFFWRNKSVLPVTDVDKKWIENSLVFLSEIFGADYFKTLPTILPGKEYFDRNFNSTEDDAIFILELLIAIMHIDAWEIQLMFYSNRPTKFSEGIIATPQEKLKGSWKSSSGKYVDNGLGNKEIWIEMDLLNDQEGLVATMAHELAHYKLLGESRMEYNDEHLTDLTAIAFGFGIFMGNSYFKFEQWQGNTHYGWQMQKKGYLPEQVIAYAMAWLAHYRNDTPSWQHYLNKTIRKYFEQSYKYIEQNKASIKWS